MSLVADELERQAYKTGFIDGQMGAEIGLAGLVSELEAELAECIGAIENIFGGGGPEIVPDWIMEEIERRENW